MSLTPKKRSTVRHLINTKLAWVTDSTDSFKLVNEGVTDLSEGFNPNTDDLQYIAEDDKTHVVKTYGPSISLTAVMVDKTDPVNDWIQKVINKLPKNDDANTEYIRFSLLDEIKNSTNDNDKIKKYTAYKRAAVVEVNSIGGSAGDNVSMEVIVSGRGEAVEGTLTVDASGETVTYTFVSSKNSINKTIEFTVTNNDTTPLPISNASVMFNSITKTTGANGKVNFDIPTNGTYLFTVAANGYTSETSNKTIDNSSPNKTEITVKLSSSGVST